MIDPGAPDDQIDIYLSRRALQLLAILNTHGHLDHTSGNEYYARKYKVKAYAHRLDRPMILTKAALMNYFMKEAHINLGGIQVLLLHIPGHTPGSVVFSIHGLLFTGDTLFQGSIGAAWGSTVDERKHCLQEEIDGIHSKLLCLPMESKVYPGHGDMTTLEKEKKDNPWLQDGVARRSAVPSQAAGNHE